ncbi:MAG: type II CRISPR RNA-guided endonuclease Cas9 [Oxalobacter sp.]|nr:type II CRISPR RNA-guided endonuclease Cas9 [Oxalobacter sp.]
MNERIIGLDIGIASVGWAVIENGKRIIDLGVRTFDKAETAKEGDSLNLIRREARLARRRLSRRAQRLRQTAHFLKTAGLIASESDLHQTLPKDSQKIEGEGKSPWQLRAEGLDRLLTPFELAKVVFHIVKHRGFHWVSSAEKVAADSDKEGGAIKKGLATTEARMKEKGFRTLGEMIWKDYPEAQRNKGGAYEKVLSRTGLDAELRVLFDVQKKLGNTSVTDALVEGIVGTGDQKTGLLWKQKPPLQGENILKMLGHCRFERNEFRAPKNSFAAERHVWLTKLNNLRLVGNGYSRELTPEERKEVLNVPYEQKGDLTYKQLRRRLEKAGFWSKGEYRFSGLRYGEKDPETAVLCKVPGWHSLEKAYVNAGLQGEWKQISDKALLESSSGLLDQLAFILSVYKEDEEVREQLTEVLGKGKDKLIDALLSIRFDQFSALSLKVLNAILPFMNAGDRYDKACEKAGYQHSAKGTENLEKTKYLPSLFSGRDIHGTMVLNEELDVPRNPVVLRAINQTRKVLNAIVKKYGSPSEVHIELGRDLSRSFSERNSIAREQKKYADRKEGLIQKFRELFNAEPNGRNLEKFRLYSEQQGKSLYCGKPIDIGRLLEPGYVEVDHILPYSRSFDDSKNNKALVFTWENRDKGNRTPFEYMGADTDGWHEFEEHVGSLKLTMAKRQRLLRKDFGDKAEKEFRDRNLNDTRYASRFFKNYVDVCLKLENPLSKAGAVSVNGRMTDFLRTRWGLRKDRSESDRHHAMDAVVVACCTRAMIQHVAIYSSHRERFFIRKGDVVDLSTGEVLNRFPVPWKQFKKEVKLRLDCNDRQMLQEELAKFGTYPEEALKAVKPLFVSRAIQRRGTGALHKETIYSQTVEQKKEELVTQKILLTDLKQSHFNSLVDYDRNEKLYETIRGKLEAAGWDGKKAFPEGSMRMLDKEGKPNSTMVKSVRITEKKTGTSIRGGLAENGLMRRVDVFKKNGQYFLVPVYFWHKELPNRAILPSKPENEWLVVDEQFEWCFSLVANDLIRLKLKDREYLGYFAGLDRSTGAISILAHDRANNFGKDGLQRGIGVRRALAFEKLAVDVLGNVYALPQEPRHELA